MAGSVRKLPPLRILDLDLHEHKQSAGVDDARASQQVAGLRAGRPEIVERQRDRFNIQAGCERGHRHAGDRSFGEHRDLELARG
jgi:hypothetical protein